MRSEHARSDRTRPEKIRPHRIRTRPDHIKSKEIWPDQMGSNQTDQPIPNQIGTDKTRLGQIPRSDPSRPDQTRSGKIGPRPDQTRSAEISAKQISSAQAASG
jgi:hypothetical protein